MSEIGRSRTGWDWADAAEEKSAEFETLRSNPAAVQLVKAHLKTSLKDLGTPGGRVPDIELHCGASEERHTTLYKLLLALEDGKVQVFYRWPDTAFAPWSDFGVHGEPGRNLDLYCLRCGMHYERSYPAVLKEAIQALALSANGEHRGRPRIVLYPS